MSTSITDEVLMAYADGELDEAARARIELAMRDDPALAARVAQHQSLRMDVFAAFAPIADEAPPPRLAAVASGKVTDLSAARAARTKRTVARRWSWPEWGGMAAALLVGIVAGYGGLKGMDNRVTVASAADGALVARGKLADALTEQLAASATTGSGVKIGVSFAARDGALCRSFTMGQAAGLACRAGGEWKLPVLAEADKATAGDYRQAGSAMPAAVLDAIDARIAGQALDAKGERAAQQRGWAR